MGSKRSMNHGDRVSRGDVVDVPVARDATIGVDSPAAVCGPVEIDLPADCRMAAQTALLAKLLGALDAPATHLDGRAVQRVDTAALQLLTLFRREATARGSAVSWLGASDILCDAAGVLGLTRSLDLPAQQPA